MSTTVSSSNGRQDPSAMLRNQLASMAGEFKNALPSHIKPEKFQRVIMTVVQQNPDLMNADRKSLLGACLKCAADGLIPDGREAALVMFNGKAQYMPMMAGIQKRVRNSGEVASVQAHVIYENDHFLWKQGLDAAIEHTPLFPGDRGKPIGAYAVAKFKDNSEPQFEVMDLTAIERVRQVSKTKNGGPWTQWWDEMARKTVFRRLSKWLPMDTDPEDLLRRDDEMSADAVNTTAQVVPMTQAVSSKLDALEGPIETTSTSIDDLAGRVAGAVAEMAGFKSYPAFQTFEPRAELLVAEAEEADRPELMESLESALEATRERFRSASQERR